MITRRSALKTLLLTSGAAALPKSTFGADAPPPPVDGVFKLPPLGYDYDALEPFFDAETMKIHHGKHHAAYVSKLNAAVAEAPGLEKKSIREILTTLDAAPDVVRSALRNHGGGHANHTLFWQILKKNENGKPAGELAAAIDKSFGSFSKFQDAFGASALKVFGSGWTWLVLRGSALAIENSANQDSPISTGGIPLLALDVWEHAYYLKYQNRRVDYVKAFQNVINWDAVRSRFASRSQD